MIVKRGASRLRCRSLSSSISELPVEQLLGSGRARPKPKARAQAAPQPSPSSASLPAARELEIPRAQRGASKQPSEKDEKQGFSLAAALKRVSIVGDDSTRSAGAIEETTEVVKEKSDLSLPELIERLAVDKRGMPHAQSTSILSNEWKQKMLPPATNVADLRVWYEHRGHRFDFTMPKFSFREGPLGTWQAEICMDDFRVRSLFLTSKEAAADDASGRILMHLRKGSFAQPQFGQ